MADLLGSELSQHRLKLRCAFAKAGDKRLERFGVGKVQTASTGKQELSAHCWHSVENNAAS